VPAYGIHEVAAGALRHLWQSQYPGLKRVIALVAHGLFMPAAAEVIAGPAIEQFVVTDTVPAFRLTSSSLSRAFR
jgi:phosphoribosylpyrophosphate synthetase